MPQLQLVTNDRPQPPHPAATPACLQVWYDSPSSLELKYKLAAELGLRGVGTWHLDCLDYRCTSPQCRNETDAMWAAVRAFSDAAATPD